MGIVLGLGGLIALIALLLKQSSEKGGDAASNYANGLPQSVKEVIIKDSKGLATKTEIEAAAGAASNAGYEKLAAALWEKAKKAPETAPTIGVPSPWDEVSNDAWTKFVRVMGTSRARTIGPRGNVGVFQMTVRRLVDFGLMKNPRKAGPKGVWTADWTIPQEKFLGDPALQYKIFTRSMEQYRNLILERYRSAIGTVFEGRAATLSGLLAVAHHAGVEGLGKWLKNDPPRKKFKLTTAAYEKANGIF